MSTPLRVLLVEDSENDAALIVRQLSTADYNVSHERVESTGQMRAALEQPDWDIVIADYKLPGFDAPAALAILQQTGLDLPFVVVSGHIGEETAAALMKAGAHDYLMKDHLTRLAPVVERELGEARMRRERQRGAEQLRLSVEELARSNAELEQFAYVASHDLQEPLRAIVGFLQLLQSRYEDKVDEKGIHYIERSVKAAYRMQTLIRELLRLSRVNSKGSTFQPTDFNFLVQGVLDNLQAIVLEKKAEVRCGLLPTLTVDEGQFRSLFQNLLFNALRYNESPQPLIDLGYQELDDTYRFYVQDNGIGILPQFHQRIFVVFQRLHTEREYPGTGLGLALCKKIIERHGGTIWVESNSSGGSTFYFTLPKEV